MREPRKGTQSDPKGIAIRNGCLIDGTGKPGYPADVLVRGDRIAGVGRFAGLKDVRVIDARGKIVCPGFIDVHSHTDWTILANPTAESTIRQGITTEVVGHCGFSLAPVTETWLPLVSFPEIDYGRCGFADMLDRVRSMGTSNNLAWLVGHNSVRVAAGASGAQATEDQCRAMESLVAEAMEAGALGISTGLEFEPGRSVPGEEILRLVRMMRKYDGCYTSHIRNRDAAIQEATEEFIGVVRECGVRGEISHFNVRYRTGAPEGAWQKAVDTVRKANEGGTEIRADMTPLEFGLGMMSAILPPWIRSDGPEAAATLMKDPAVRARLRSECDRYWRFIHRGEWDRIRVMNSPAFPEINGLPFPNVAEMWGKDPWDCYFDILCAAGKDMDGISLIGKLWTPEHIRECMSHPLFMLGVDGYSSKTTGSLGKDLAFPLHYIGMIHYIAHHVRESRILSLEEAIRKMTGMPAAHFSLRDRGVIREGCFADIIVFDFEGLDEASTIEDPLRYARGVEHVLVNGTPVVSDGEHTGARPGRNLLRH
jgi:N-acyl-D-amino-acid deacylase